MRWRWWRPRNGHAAAAQQEQEAKLREFRRHKPDVKREVDRFTAAVEQALRGSR